MQYMSTRDVNAWPVSASCAIRRGIAVDGGLYVPQDFPAYLPKSWSDLDYQTMARGIFALYLTDFTDAEISSCVEGAYGSNFPPLVAPCVTVGGVEVLELFHGPTAAFKDIALQALPRFLTHALAHEGAGAEAVILAATSGDTGKAALEGFKDVPGTRIIVFYPEDGVSTAQKLQMITTTGSNVSVVSVAGNFDDCQAGVKALFGDDALRERMSAAGFEFSSANSINFGRLLPQIVYYYYGYAQMVGRGRIKPGLEIQIAVPSGNFGNLLAAYYAKRMGLPVSRLVCASNINDVLTEAITAGSYNRLRDFYKTTSPSMDILVSSNFERFLFEMYERDALRCATDFGALSRSGGFTVPTGARQAWSGFLTAGSASEDEVRDTIGRIFERYGYLLDPHTAVGWKVLEGVGGGEPFLLAATASPYKFTEAALTALGRDVDGMTESGRQELLSRMSGVPIPAALAGIEELPKRHDMHTSIDGMRAAVEGILSI